MKKRQLVAMALVSAMSVSTAASFVPAKTYAAEKTEKQMLLELVTELKKATFNSEEVKSFLDDFDTKEEVKALTEAEAKEFKEVLMELKVLTGKKLGSLEVKKSILDSYAAIPVKNLRYPGNGSLVVFRADKLKELEENETKAVKEAEAKLKEEQEKLDSYYASKDSAKITAQAAVVEKAAETLNAARAAEVVALDKIYDTIVKTETSKLLPDAVEAYEQYIASKLIVVENTQTLRNITKQYLAANEVNAKYKTEEDLVKAKKEVQKAFDKFEDELVAKVNRQVLEANNIAKSDLKKMLSDKLEADKVILIKNVLTEAELKEYKEKYDANKAFQAISLANLKTLKTDYENANKAVKDATKDLARDEKASKDMVKLLDFLTDVNAANVKLGNYVEHLKSTKAVAEKVNTLEGKVITAKSELEEAKKALAAAEEALVKDPENVVLKSDVTAKKTVFETKEKAYNKLNEQLTTVREDFNRLNNLTKDLHAKYRAYVEAAIRGVGNYELEMVRAEFEKSLAVYNNFAKDYSLPKIDLSRAAEVTTGTWVKVEGVWYYKDARNMDVYKNAWAKIDGQWYRFDEAGKMLANQWFKEDGKWYWLEASGSMASSEWVYVKGSWFWAHSSGRIAENEWVWVKGQWYYAKSGGYLAMNTSLRIDGTVYKFAKSGAWVK